MKIKILALITTIFTLVYIAINMHLPLSLNLANGFFIVGLAYLLIALMFYVRNVGFFKLISYHRYKKRQIRSFKSKSGKSFSQRFSLDDMDIDNEDVMKLHEFCDEHYKEQWSNKELYIFSVPLLIISYVLSFIIK